MSDSEALELALALHETPQRAGLLRGRPLPAEGVTSLLRLALAQPDALADAASRSELPAELLIDAARFFVEQQMLVEECEKDPWRVLGLPPGTPEHRLREHHRLLVRLVHPDRSSDWPAAFADRVNKAWRLLRNPEARTEAAPVIASLPIRDVPGLVPYRPSFLAAANGLLPAAAPRLRHLPLLLVGGIVLTAATLLWLDGWVTANYGSQSALAASERERRGVAETLVNPVDAQAGTASRTESLQEVNPSMPIAMQALARAEPDTGVALGLGAFFSYLGSTWAAHQRMRADQALAAIIQPVPGAHEALPTAADARAQVTARRERAGADAIVMQVSPIARQSTAMSLTAERRPVTQETPQALLSELSGSAFSAAPGESIKPSMEESEQQVRQLLQRFGQRYREGDLIGLLELFALNANAEQGGLPSLAAEYSRVFGATRTREMRFEGVHWVQDRGRIRGGARVEIETSAPGRARRSVSSSHIDFEVLLDGQRAQILRWVSSASSGGV